jgi:hypothetical protein
MAADISMEQPHDSPASLTAVAEEPTLPTRSDASSIVDPVLTASAAAPAVSAETAPAVPFPFEDAGDPASDPILPSRGTDSPAACEAAVEVVTANGVARDIIVTCACGRRTTLRVEYDETREGRPAAP